MFESDRFQDNHELPAGNGFGAWVNFQQELVTWMCIFVIFGSMFFYFAVMYSEIFGKLPMWVRKILCLKKEIDINKDRDIYGNSEVEMIFQNNPHLQDTSARKEAEAATAELREQLAAQQDMLLLEKQKAAKVVAQGGAKPRKRGGRGAKKKKAKKGFAPTKLTSRSSEIQKESMDEILTGLKTGLKTMEDSQNNGSTNELSLDSTSSETSNLFSTVNIKPDGAGHQHSKSFRAHNSSDGTEYYEDAETGAVTWVLPENAAIIKK